MSTSKCANAGIKKTGFQNRQSRSQTLCWIKTSANICQSFRLSGKERCVYKADEVIYSKVVLWNFNSTYYLPLPFVLGYLCFEVQQQPAVPKGGYQNQQIHNLGEMGKKLKTVFLNKLFSIVIIWENNIGLVWSWVWWKEFFHVSHDLMKFQRHLPFVQLSTTTKNVSCGMQTE